METSETSLVIFQDAGKPVEVRLDAAHDTVWLTQQQMAYLFKTSTGNISLHLKHIFEEEELSEKAATEESSLVRRVSKGTQDSFEAIVLRAVNLGDDAYTVGAVAGQIAGAYYG